MTRPILLGALTATLVVLAASSSLLAADTWPWKSKLPPDPALVQLVSVDSVSRRH